MVDAELLKIMCCPETHQPVRLADVAMIEEINTKIDQGQVRNRAGAPVAERLDGGLVRQDGKVLYPVRGQIPVMLIDEAICLDEFVQR